MSWLAALGSSSSGYDGSTAPHPVEVVLLVLLAVVYLAIVAVGVWAYVRVTQKAGYSGWYVLVLLVPLVNVVFVLLFAFKEWPVERELAYLRWRVAQLESGHASPLPPSAPRSPGGSLG